MEIERERSSYPLESTFMVTKFKELKSIRPCMGISSLVLVLENGNSGDSKLCKCFEFGGLEVSPKQSIQFPTHYFCSNEVGFVLV